MAGSSAELLRHLASQARELRELQGWTQAELARRVRLPVEDLIELENSDFDAAPLVRGVDGSVDVAPWMRRRWLNRLAAVIETLCVEGGGAADEAREHLRAGTGAADRAGVLDLLRSDEPKDWWAGARLAVLFGDQEAVPLLREIAFAGQFAAGRLSRDRAFAALAELGIPVGAPAGSLALADRSDSGRLALATERGAMSLPEEIGDASTRNQAPDDDEGANRSVTIAAVGIALRAAAFLISAIAVLLFVSAIAAGIFGASSVGLSLLVYVSAMLVGLAISVAFASRLGRRIIDDAFAWTRKRWARNRAQRLRGS